MKAGAPSHDDLQLARLVFRLSRQYTRLFDGVLQSAYGLATKDLIVLRQLRAGSIYPGQISEQLGMPPASVSRALEHLESQGFIVRSVDASDRRRFRLATTERGEQAVREIRELLQAALREAYDQVPAAARDAANDTLEELSAALERSAA